MNYDILNQRIKESGIKKETFKSALNCSYKALSNRLSGKVVLSVDEANKIAKVLNLTDKERNIIFFGK